MSIDPRPEDCLSSATLVDSAHPAVVAFAKRHAEGGTDRERAVSLYYAVRDGFRYDPYRIDLTPGGMSASSVIENGHGWCVPKATLLAAVCRAAGIPARVGFADVRNHLSTERMREQMKTDVFAWHGYADLWIDGAWRKATPAFNVELCEKFGLLPLDFDGVSDSIFHPFDATGHRHMEYIRQRGTFDDVPLQALIDGFREVYPEGFGAPASAKTSELAKADFLADVAREPQARPGP
ncbi:transglutaminase-like domain-containing protein [Ramlibacter sp.]|uniref:transglutaminase-like domain-containing protein n=1 Tax=Ramlibacter sp. TaxID=1917967 RepID=UPI003D0E8E85